MTKSNGNTTSKPTIEKALGNVPKKFRTPIIKEYKEIKKRFSEALFDAAGLSTGKLVETVLRFLQYHLTGSYIPFGKHIPNFNDECRKLITLPTSTSSGNESLRVIIPRCLAFLYTLRGKRGIGHVGGDVEANSIDAATIVRVCDWMICELIRIFHNLSLEEAQDIVDAVSSRNLPDIWEVAGKKRVLRTDLSTRQKTLLLAYSDVQSGLLVEDLFTWVEYSNIGMYKKKVLKPLHDEKLIEYDRESEAVFLSPLGVQEVELSILRKSII